jgi:uncharacterized protein YjbI with pentapeptide repeats
MKKKGNLITTVGIVFLVVGISLVFLNKYPDNWKFSSFIKEYYANLSCELISIAITILLIDYLYEKKEKGATKKRLLRELGSEDRGFTSRALKELKELGSLTDGSLIGLDLSKANLSGLDFSNANLSKVNFENALLNGTVFKSANLDGTILNGAEMREANLENCSFTNTKMKKCNLYGALLNNSKITNVDLMKSNLELSELIDVIIIDTKLEDANLKLANLTRIKITNCHLLRTDVHSINAKNAKFERCDLKDIQGLPMILEGGTAEFLACLNIPEGFSPNHN